jgi:hypothetical protein
VTENTAKWLHEHLQRRAGFRPGQLVIIDEASLASTRSLDLITGHAQMQGAKVVLVGDPHQLGAVGAGGVLGLLANDRPDHPRLTGIHRFHHRWEAQASLLLRAGERAAIDTYSRHGRVHAGDTDEMLQRAFQAWRHDIDSGRSSLLIAGTTEHVTALNHRARADRQSAGQVGTAQEVPLRDGTAASAGDWIITRRNQRNMQTADGEWVRNGDRWQVRAIHPDGSLTAHRPDHPDQQVRLPADYVAGHVELGYAVTAHRAQGATVDTAHVVATRTMTREQLYVALTRGRHANHVWNATDHPTDKPHHDGPADTGAAVLARILDHRGPGRSAHEGIAAEQDRWGGTAQLTAEHQAITAAARSHASTAAANAIRERRQLIEQHADQLLWTAIRERQPWLTHLGRPPADAVPRQRWITCARTIAAYRDRHGITDRAPLGQHERHAPRPDQQQALEAIRILQQLAAAMERPPTRPHISNRLSGPTM